MRPTVAFPVSAKPIEKDTVHAWANEEGLKALGQMRTAHNLQGKEAKSASTATLAAFQTLWTSPAMPANATWGLEVALAGMSASGAPAQQAFYKFAGTFISVASAVSQLGATTTIVTNESAAAIDFRFLVDAVGRTVAVQARDDGTSQMYFNAVVTTTEVIPT